VTGKAGADTGGRAGDKRNAVACIHGWRI